MMDADQSLGVLDACPCCGSELGPVFYETGAVPVHSCLMMPSAEEAMAFPKGVVQLVLCEACGFVANRAFDPKWSAYAPNYEDQQSFSPTFNSFAGALARDLVGRHGLGGKTVVEVGCSKGDFLALLCEAGMAEGIGIDPSAVEGRVAPPRHGRMRLIPEYYGPEHLDIAADLICCRHTLEHIQPVHETLRLMHAHASRTDGARLCIEVPDATRLWRDCAFEDIYYEHCSYFTAGSLARAVRRAGFAVTDLRREYGDQYLVIEASLDPAEDRQFAIEEPPEDTVREVQRFADRVSGVIQAWRQKIADAHEQGQVTAIWGSGSKCVAFARMLGGLGHFNAIVDINPFRWEKYAPGSSLPISSPKALKSVRPDLIVVLNQMYLNEISEECAHLGISAQFVALGNPPTKRSAVPAALCSGLR